MNPTTQNQTRERMQTDFTFITEVFQNGRIRPAKYVHSLEISQELFVELKKAGIIDIEALYIDNLAFFEFKHCKAIISFVHFYVCNDLHIRIDNYLLVKALGKNPVKRFAQSKMNADKNIEIVQHVCKQRIA